MKYRALGRTGFQVSDMAIGLWGMGDWTGSDDQESLKSLQLTVDLGCNFFDTAWAYGNGKSDGLLGEILTRNKFRNAKNMPLYAASKIPPMNDIWPATPEFKYSDVFPAKHVFEYTKKIREKLREDSIDVLQFHVWDDSWSQEPEFRETVEKLKADKWIRSFGLSLNRWQPENGIEALRTGLVDAVQVIYNIFDQAPEDKLFPVCRELNVGSDRPRPSRRRQPRRKNDPRNEIPSARLARPILRPRKLARNHRSRGRTKKGRASRNDSPGHGAAIHSVESHRQHHDRGHAQARARKTKHRPQRRRPPRRRPPQKN